MFWWIIKMTDGIRPQFVESYSNTRGVPIITFNKGIAKPFETQEEAFAWAKKYVAAHDYQVVKHTPEPLQNA